jgi:hypothetical protein
MILRREGYWTTSSFKVELTKEEKRQVDRYSTPRWEIDLLAYKGATNELLVVECKSFLDSTGVVFRNSAFEPPERYKLFSDSVLREVVLNRLTIQLQKSGACAQSPVIRLALATGKIARKTDVEALKLHFQSNGWLLFDSAWVQQKLASTIDAGYENEVALVVAKILLRANESA